MYLLKPLNFRKFINIKMPQNTHCFVNLCTLQILIIMYGDFSERIGREIHVVSGRCIRDLDNCWFLLWTDCS